MAYCNESDLQEFLQQEAVDSSTWPDSGVLRRHIDLASSEIDAALAASDQYDCTKADWANTFLRLMNVIGAMLLTEFDNIRQLTEGDLGRYQTWKDKQLELLRTGDLTMCQGETNKEYPAFNTAEQAWTPEAAGQIIRNRILRSGNG